MNSSLVARVRDILIAPPPIGAVAYTAASESVLRRVPSDGHAFMAVFAIIFHCLVHLFLDLLLGATRVHGKDVYGTGDLKWK